MGFRSTGVRLVANVTQYIRELNRSADTTRKFGQDLDAARLKGARMANEIAGSAKASSAELTAFRENVRKLDDQIRTTRDTLHGLAKGFADTNDVGVFKQIEAQRKKLKSLTDVRNLLPDPRIAAEAGSSLAKRMADSFRGTFTERVGAAAAPAAIALYPAFSAAIAGAVVGAAGAGGVIGGIMIAARDPRVKGAGADLSEYVLGDLEHRAARFVQPTLNAIERVRLGWQSLGPDLDRVFKADRFVEPLAAGAVRGGQAFLKGFANAIDHADPVMEAISNMVATAGSALGDFFTQMGQDAQQGAAALNDLSLAVNYFVEATGNIIHNGVALFGYLGQLDKVIDRTRYWIEDNNLLMGGMVGLNDTIDLTADGFKRGSVEAEAYRRATEGTATATDFATLSAAGMKDAQIAAADASGTFRASLDGVKGAAGGAGSAMDDVAKKAQIVAIAADPAWKAMELVATKMREADAAARGELGALKALGDQLRTQSDPAYAMAKAEEAVRKAAKEAADASKEFGAGSIDARNANLKLAAAVTDLMAKAGDLSSKFDGHLTPAMKAAMDSAHLTKGQVKGVEQSLIDARKAAEKYARDYAASIALHGYPAVAKKLAGLMTFQEALKKGTDFAVALTRRDKVERQLGLAEGGPVRGPGTTTSDSIPARLSNNEHVWTATEVAGAGGHQQVEKLRDMAQAGQLPLMYARGGPVVLPYPVDVSQTRIPSRKEVSAAVMPQFGDWPSSPSAQRGDSGVWRRIVQLIKSTGPMSGHFGNAYRPGDPLWHGSGRAVDWMGFNQDRLATFLANKRPLELIHRTNQRDYAYTRGKNKGSFNNALMQAHRNHIHIAMHNGGVIREPVVGIGASGASYSFGERGPEVVMPAGGAGRNANTVINVSVQAGYVVTERALEDKIAATVDNLVRKGRI